MIVVERIDHDKHLVLIRSKAAGYEVDLFDTTKTSIIIDILSN